MIVDAEIAKLLAALSAAIAREPALGGTVKIDFGAAGSVLLDGTAAANAAQDGAGHSADATIALSLETAARLKAGTLEPTTAFFQGKLRVSGDFALAMKAGTLLQKALG